MDFKTYIVQTDETAVYPQAGTARPLEIAYIGLGLAGETGELVDLLKKIVRLQGHTPGTPYNAGRHAKGPSMKQVQEELGDVMWYIARLCKIFHLDMDTVLQQNYDKLSARKATGTLKVR